MKQKKLALFIFIDAFGWELLQRHRGFAADIAPYRKPLETVFGYSSACDPTFLSGLLPSEHGHWSSFYYSPKSSPFGWTKIFRLLPSFLSRRHPIRRRIAGYIAKKERITGHFELYQMPFEQLPLFDYAEKKWLFGTRRCLIAGQTIFELLLDRHIPFYVKESSPISDQFAWEQAEALIRKRWISFAFLFLGRLDALMHAKGPDDPSVGELIESYDRQIRELFQLAERKYPEVSLCLFSDHGMHRVERCFDLMAEIKRLGLSYGKEYAAFYDSTMARFWFLREGAKERILKRLSELEAGSLLSDRQLAEWGVYFPDHRYGEAIFLMRPGTLVLPSFMGYKPVAGMHGYDPSEPDSLAMVAMNRPLPEQASHIKDLFFIMSQEIEEKNTLLSGE